MNESLATLVLEYCFLIRIFAGEVEKSTSLRIMESPSTALEPDDSSNTKKGLSRRLLHANRILRMPSTDRASSSSLYSLGDVTLFLNLEGIISMS